jgi:hypothetical protein
VKWLECTRLEIAGLRSLDWGLMSLLAPDRSA